jgi:SH3 domain-containing protein
VTTQVSLDEPDMRRVIVPSAVLGGCLLTVALAAAHAGAASDERRITNAASVRLRSAPVASASIAAELPLGTELIAFERTNAADPWYRVQSDDGHTGWVLGSLTTSLDLERRDQTIESIVLARLSRLSPLKGESFSTRLQLFDLIERTTARLNDGEAQARFALYRLRSLNDVALGVPFRRGDSDPYRSWIRAHREEVTYNEPGGSWMVDASHVVQTHEKYPDTAAADDIAWFLVTNGVRGECEGDVPCYIDKRNQLSGQYLRWHPRGRHADESNEDIARALNGIMDNLRAFPLVLQEFDPGTRCGELHTSLDPLVAAVTASTSARKEEALAAIDRFAQLCR